ncbi:hypothetical protein [Neptuniibacter sp.]|uniref:hypothetical protein n=1 Tax=Neptuniibacter sp. TaxID=1962643 RepID=UPI003B5C65D8
MAFWSVFLLAVGLNTLANLLLKPESSHGATAQKFSVPTTQPGGWPGVLAGTRWIEGSHVAWYGDVRPVPIKKSGGKK